MSFRRFAIPSSPLIKDRRTFGYRNIFGGRKRYFSAEAHNVSLSFVYEIKPPRVSAFVDSIPFSCHKSSKQAGPPCRHAVEDVAEFVVHGVSTVESGPRNTEQRPNKHRT